MQHRPFPLIVTARQVRRGRLDALMDLSRVSRRQIRVQSGRTEAVIQPWCRFMAEYAAASAAGRRQERFHIGKQAKLRAWQRFRDAHAPRLPVLAIRERAANAVFLTRPMSEGLRRLIELDARNRAQAQKSRFRPARHAPVRTARAA